MAEQRPVQLSLAQARALMLRAQGFPPPARPSLVRVLEQTAFARTLGGVEVYLALRARMPGITRAAVDTAVVRGEIRVSPSVRGCVYLIPDGETPASLRAADLLTRGRSEREAEKAGIRAGEVEAVARRIAELLGAQGPMTTDAIRRGLPAGTVRSLGETGKKIGVSSPLPLSLRRLEFEGRIERTLDGGRMDTERYLWRARDGAMASGFAASKSRGASDGAEPALWRHFAEIFFRAAGVGTLADFAEWAGIAKREAAAAVEGLPVIPAGIAGESGPFLLWKAAWPKGADPEAVAEAIGFLPFDDNLTALHGGPRLLVDEAHHGLPVPQWGGKDTTLGASRHMAFRTFVAGGKLAGVWEYDPDEKTVRTVWFGRPAAEARRRVEAAAADTARFIADELGHGRSFSLDTDDDLRERAARIRKLH